MCIHFFIMKVSSRISKYKDIAHFVTSISCLYTIFLQCKLTLTTLNWCPFQCSLIYYCLLWYLPQQYSHRPSDWSCLSRSRQSPPVQAGPRGHQSTPALGAYNRKQNIYSRRHFFHLSLINSPVFIVVLFHNTSGERIEITWGERFVYLRWKVCIWFVFTWWVVVVLLEVRG